MSSLLFLVTGSLSASSYRLISFFLWWMAFYCSRSVGFPSASRRSCRFHVHPSIHPSSALGRVVQAERPVFPLPRHFLLGGSKGIPRPAQWHSHSSMSWVFPEVSSQKDRPWTPPEGGVQGASDTAAHATSAGSSWCGRAAALLRAPPRVTELLTPSLIPCSRYTILAQLAGCQLVFPLLLHTGLVVCSASLGC